LLADMPHCLSIVAKFEFFNRIRRIAVIGTATSIH